MYICAQIKQLMSKYIIIILIAFTTIACQNTSDKLPADMIQNPNSAEGFDDSQKIPLVKFKTMEHDFGYVIKGEVVSYSFKITNSGQADLLIAEVTTTCGCTVSKYPVDPIKPGETKNITAIFNSEDRIGFQNKRITVLTNATPARYVLKILAEVIKPE